jgi:opacity protein-like surface antigen
LGSAQTWKLNRIEAYGGLSTFHYFGDIGGSADENNLFGLKDIKLRSTRFGFSGGIVYRVEEKLYIKGYTSFGFFTQTDKGSINAARNNSFTTNANEISLQAMYFIIPESEQNYHYSVMQLRGGLRHLNNPLSVYAFAGIGGLFFSVTPKDNLVTDNRFNGDHSFAVVIPVGIGVKYAALPRISVGAEIGGRFVTSDYIDGFTTVNSKHNDVYYLMNLKVYYRFPRSKKIKGYQGSINKKSKLAGR